MHTTQSRHAGFTLLEIALSVALLVVLASGVIAFFAISAKMQNSSREREVARVAAVSKMEEILAWLDHDTLAAAFAGTSFSAGPLKAPGGGTPGTVTVDSANPDLLLVTIHVAWEGAGGSDELELSTTIANPDPGP
jgi:prepilin-type N-terminal cleavage/methylation domain-containing protein